MSAFTIFKNRLSALGLHYIIDREIRRNDKSFYQWATICSDIPNTTAKTKVLTLVRKDECFDLWLLSKTPLEISRSVDNIAAHLVGQMMSDGSMTEADDDEWIRLATAGYGAGEPESDRIPNPSARWLESKTKRLAGA